MSVYLPPTHINRVYNNADYEYQNGNVTLSTTEQRYLKKVGADTSYADTTFQNNVTFAGLNNITFNNSTVTFDNGTDLEVNSVAFFNQGISATNSGSASSTFDNLFVTYRSEFGNVPL